MRLSLQVLRAEGGSLGFVAPVETCGYVVVLVVPFIVFDLKRVPKKTTPVFNNLKFEPPDLNRQTCGYVSKWWVKS